MESKDRIKLILVMYLTAGVLLDIASPGLCPYIACPDTFYL